MGAFYLSRLFSLSMVCFYLKCCFDFLVFFFLGQPTLVFNVIFFLILHTLFPHAIRSTMALFFSFIFCPCFKTFFILFFIVFWNVLAPIELLSFGSSSHCLQRFSFNRNVSTHYIQRYFSPYMRIFFFNSFWIFLNNLSP